MNRKIKKFINQITLCFIFVVFTVSVSLSQIEATSAVVREDVFAAKTSDQFKTAYLTSQNKLEKIAAIQALPRAIKQFNVNLQSATPAWLTSIVNDGLNSSDSDVTQSMVEQIGNCSLVSFADALISMYRTSNTGSKDLQSIVLRTKIIRALGNLGTPATISLLGNILNAHLVSPETDEALGAISRLCATDLIPQINGYVKDLRNKINNSAFIMDDPLKKPMVPPEGSLSIALSTVQMLGNGNCGK